VLLISRATAAVRAELLEIAALVRWSPDPHPECIAQLRGLLTNGCGSPLYNGAVPAEELKATSIAPAHRSPPTRPYLTQPHLQGGTACR
jgi:hypothetical protein